MWHSTSLTLMNDQLKTIKLFAVQWCRGAASRNKKLFEPLIFYGFRWDRAFFSFDVIAFIALHIDRWKNLRSRISSWKEKTEKQLSLIATTHESMTHPQSQIGSYNIIECDAHAWSYDIELSKKQFFFSSVKGKKSLEYLFFFLFFSCYFDAKYCTLVYKLA